MVCGHEQREIQLRQALTRSADDCRHIRNELVEMHIELTLAMARYYARGNNDVREELESDLLHALIRAAERYDPAKAAFWTFAHAYLRGCVRMFFRKRGRHARFTDLANAEAVTMGDNLPDTVIDKLADEKAIRWARLMLSQAGLPVSAPAVEALLGETTRRDAAQELGMNYDVLCRKLNLALDTRAACVFRACAMAGANEITVRA